jgi:hypothetical protein
MERQLTQNKTEVLCHEVDDNGEDDIWSIYKEFHMISSSGSLSPSD